MADGVFKAELNNFLSQELSEDGYSGVEVRVTPTRTEIIILATRTQNVLGEKGRRIRELTAVVQKRFNFPVGTVEVTSHLHCSSVWATFVCARSDQLGICFSCMLRKWQHAVSVQLLSVSLCGTS